MLMMQICVNAMTVASKALALLFYFQERKKEIAQSANEYSSKLIESSFDKREMWMI